MNTDFRFSPRPNRAHEIAWQRWDEGAFALARERDVPLLLSISAVWCHWCHVMDETSYSDPRVIAAINERFVAVRVDNDRRPDVNARYNQGGWPTTAFLSADGSLLAGATYVPPEQMLDALDRVADFYRENKERIELRSADRPAPKAEAREGALRPAMVARVVEEISAAYDPEYGGFGTAPKFPMTDVLDALVYEYVSTKESRLYEMAASSMRAMAQGGMYDRVEGGFFRYSTTRDWSVPHFEKMSEDHAGLLRVLAHLVRLEGGETFRPTLISALAYVRTVLRDPETGLFAGSQDADEAYFALPAEERRARTAPYVDRTSYSNWTAALAGAFAIASDALDDRELVREAAQTLDVLHERMRDHDGLLYHYAEPGAQPQVRGLLTDQAAYLRALLDAHEFLGEARFLERAVALATAIQTIFGADGGGFYDHAAIERTLGALDVRDRPLQDNAVLAECYLRLADLELSEGYRETAAAALGLYAATYTRMGLFAAGYARALQRFFDPSSTIVLVGSPAETVDLRRAAHRLTEPPGTVRTIAPDDDAALRRRGMTGAHPIAYRCRGNACSAPARTARELQEV